MPLAGWWWADPVAALPVVPTIAKEGVDGLRGKVCNPRRNKPITQIAVELRITKTREPKRIQLPDIAVDALRALPSYGHHEYVFPAKAVRN
jgi:hypothetical protein